MTHILVISSGDGSRHWEHRLVERLSAAGHDLAIRHAAVAARQGPLDLVLKLEAYRQGPGLCTFGRPLHARERPGFLPDLVIDLTGSAPTAATPVLRMTFNGRTAFGEGLAAMLAPGAQAHLHVTRNGVAVAQARPMTGDRVWLSRYCTDILAGAMALMEQAVARFSAGRLDPIADADLGGPAEKAGFMRHYPGFLLRGAGARLVQKAMFWRRPFYWRVAYRLIEGAGVADTGVLDGPAFRVLPDDGQRFYADPFPVEHDGRRFLFVEEYPYATGKGVISVAEMDEKGIFATPRIVLEEPHHLSYPQILFANGQVYMLPESSAAHELVLYRAERFPEGWVRDSVLIAGRDISDATVLEADGRYWLVATEHFGHGSPSDKMVVYSAPALHGPWQAHALNPIAIDHSAARPGGNFIRQDGRIVLPVQDGSQSYGGGLGLMTLERLDDNAVAFSRPRSVRPGLAWATIRSGIHTLNRAGSLEAVDSSG